MHRPNKPLTQVSQTNPMVRSLVDCILLSLIFSLYSLYSQSGAAPSDFSNDINH